MYDERNIAANILLLCIDLLEMSNDKGFVLEDVEKNKKNLKMSFTSIWRTVNELERLKLLKHISESPARNKLTKRYLITERGKMVLELMKPLRPILEGKE